jgi:PAS domain S-box-containing protein
MSQVESAKRQAEQRDASPDRELGTPHLRSMLSTAELVRRPSRPPDYAAENRALIALAQVMATSPDTVLQKLADTALTLCRAHSAGLSLLEEGDLKNNFHWRAIAGQWARHINGGTPRNFGPCGTVLDQDVAMVCSHPEVDFPYWAPIKPVLEEGLLIPFHIKGEAVGTIWVVAHDTSRRFDAEDLRVMTNLGAFAASAYQTLLSLNATQRIASIVESSDDAIVSKDLNGVIINWNKGAERIFGYTAEEAVGKPITILIPPDRLDEEPSILERIRRGERVEHFETVRMRKHGSRVDISLTISPVKNAEGKIIGASKIARDITERKRNEAQLPFSLVRPNIEPRTCWRPCRRRFISRSPTRQKVSSRQSRDASRRSRTSTGCSSNRAGREPSFTVWPRRSLRPTPKAGRRACRLPAQVSCWSRTPPRQLRWSCTS